MGVLGRSGFRGDVSGELPIVPMFAFMAIYLMVFMAFGLPQVLDNSFPDADGGVSDDGLIDTVRSVHSVFWGLLLGFFTFDIGGAPLWLRLPMSIFIIGMTSVVMIWTLHKVLVAIGALIPFT